MKAEIVDGELTVRSSSTTEDYALRVWARGQPGVGRVVLIDASGAIMVWFGTDIECHAGDAEKGDHRETVS